MRFCATNKGIVFPTVLYLFGATANERISAEVTVLCAARDAKVAECHARARVVL